MGKQKSDLVSDMMRGAQIIKAISDALRDQGGDDNYLKKILGEHSPFPGRIADLLMEQEQNKKKLACASHPSDTLASSYGLTVVEDVEPSNFKISDLELVPFLKPEDSGKVSGETLRARAVTLKANLGLVDAKRMLDHQSEIPTEFRGKVLIFTGTLLRGSVGGLQVAYLYWGGVRWCLCFCWFGGDFDDYSRLVRCK